MGFKAAGAAHAREPGQRVARQLSGSLLLQPLGHGRPVVQFGVGGGPGGLRRHLLHQLPEAGLQGQGLLPLGCGQVELGRAEEQQAGGEVVLHAGVVGHAVPEEHPFALIVGGVAAQAELLQQPQQVVVAGAHPLAPQVHRQPGDARNAAMHPPAPALAGLQQPHPQPGAPQSPGTHQPGEPGSHHHGVGPRR